MAQAEAGASTEMQGIWARSQAAETGETVSAVWETIMTSIPAWISSWAASSAPVTVEPESR